MGASTMEEAMKGYTREQSAMQRQGRKRGICRNMDPSKAPPQKEASYREGYGGICGGMGQGSGSQQGTPPPEPATGGNLSFTAENLQILKEQALRLAKALQEIETRIEAFGKGQGAAK